MKYKLTTEHYSIYNLRSNSKHVNVASQCYTSYTIVRSEQNKVVMYDYHSKLVHNIFDN